MTPLLQFIEVGHDADCSGRYMNGEGCACSPSFTLHADEQRYVRAEATNRAARRAAAREAAPVLRKARRASK